MSRSRLTGSTTAMLVRSRAEKTSRASCSAFPATPPEMESLYSLVPDPVKVLGV